MCFRVNDNNGNLLYVVKSFHSLQRLAWKFGLSSKNESAGGNCKVFSTCIELAVFFSDSCQVAMLVENSGL